MPNFITVSLSRHLKSRMEFKLTMKTRYITIEREYGSGGTQIARQLAQATGIPYYGQEILENVSKKIHMTIDEIRKYEEGVTNSLLYTFYMMAQAHSGSSDMLAKEGHVFVAEQSEIQKLAKQGKAIFVGRCASEALKDQKGVVKVFIRCSNDHEKEQRIIEEYGIDKSEVERTKKRIDKRRADYYYANTARRWNDYNNYDIMLDSASLGIDGCVEVLKSVLL